MAGWRTGCRNFVRAMGDMEVAEITKQVVNRWAEALGRSDLAANTANAYMRQVRSVFFKAVDMLDLDVPNPFRTSMIKTEQTVKRALSPMQVRRIMAMDGLDPETARARDTFMLMIWLRGIAPVDLWNLRPRDVRDGWLTYRRSKTGALIRFPMEPEARRLLGELGFADGTKRNPRNEQRSINRRLRRIGEEVGFSGLTLYCARHTWATASMSSGTSRSDISQMMGHKSEKTTEIYLAGLDTPFLDGCHRRTMAYMTGIG